MFDPDHILHAVKAIVVFSLMLGGAFYLPTAIQDLDDRVREWREARRKWRGK